MDKLVTGVVYRMWNELAFAIALQDYWMRIRRQGPGNSRYSLITLLRIWERAAIEDYIDRLHASRPGASAEGAK